ncbi:metallophosphoesterase family protein [Candidatus Sumerlaeota bacterium]|nr:metallophosphoesterase family protein [Candidatus Sumerlaeota bacterium]MBI3736317.1 metallophosphoesterase family protein [Candidatus Sumerlaeota bacterium]
MQLLFFSDLHCDLEAARRLVEKSREVDAVVGAGDFGNARSGVGTCISALKPISCPVILVPGNSESAEELSDACAGWKSAHVLHGSSITILGEIFFGIGGGIPVTPFGAWSYDFTEDQARQLLAHCPPQCILVSHSPPMGTLDVSSSGRSLGSVAIREAIEQKRPKLVVCGHIHACAGKSARLGASDVVNAGPQGMVWELPASSNR